MIIRPPFLFPAFFLASLFASADIPLTLSLSDGSGENFREAGPGIVEIQGAISLLATPGSPPPAGDLVLEFEYFCAGGVPEFAVLPGPPFEARTARKLPPAGHSEAWTTYVARLNPPDKPLPETWKQLRLDLPLPAGRTLQIRNANIRPERPGDFARAASTAADSESLEAYLDGSYPANIRRVAVGADSIEISGTSPSPLLLAEIPMEHLLTDPARFEFTIPVTPSADGGFSIKLPRTRDRNGLTYDRLVSRWQLIRETDTAPEVLSHARYADEIASRSPDLPPAKPSSKKGLGGWNHGRIPGELEALGITAVTVNMMVHSLISPEAGPDTTPYQWQGKTYHARNAAVARFDETFRKAAMRDAMVSVILLIANPAKDGAPVVKILGHPDAHRDGIFAMPNVTSTEGLDLYGGILNFMAERWSRPGGEYGRVHHWIIHNEVDAGWVWTNAGEKSAVSYMDLYHRSMRLTDLIARQYDPNSRAFVTLTHHWAHPGEARWYGSKRITDLLVRFCRAEGDFPWGMAYHPYPQDLFNPRAWEDDQATFTFDTHKITPKNLEVLDAYMKRPELLYRGEVRPVHLSENGFNSKDYSEKELEDQAAGMAMAWKKISELSSIESWQYHNWIDNRGEGGLRIGLRKFHDEPGDPHGKKPIWHLYQALATPEEDEACAPWLKTIGISSWEEIIHRDAIR